MASSAFLTVGELESHLWEAANILRGPVDAADFKTFVFPLLFFKRICDAHDEEYEAALAESDGDEEYARFPQHYRFQVPEGCHWNHVRAFGESSTPRAVVMSGCSSDRKTYIVFCQI